MIINLRIKNKDYLTVIIFHLYLIFVRIFHRNVKYYELRSPSDQINDNKKKMYK